MKSLSTLALCCASFLIALGCDSAQTIEPAEAGERGENCQARNDCQKGLACISGTCSRNDFDISATAKQCDVIECESTEDCCGDRPTSAPAKCANVNSICSTPTLPGCVSTSCSDDGDCGAGVCGQGRCDTDFSICSTDTECSGTCVGGFCSNTSFSCVDDTDCGGTCESRSCDCRNEDFDPSDAICSDPECQDVCVLRCEEERCVVDDACESDIDCPNGAPMCDGGRCLQCLEDADCDEDEGEVCLEGRCDTPCEHNEECPLFHSCEDGDCVETGCTSDRECVLAQTGTGADDARLAKCLPSDIDPETPICKVPCENDGSCAQFQICEDGFCKFIGCDEDEECRAFLGLENEQMSEDRPYVSRAVCRE